MVLDPGWLTLDYASELSRCFYCIASYRVVKTLSTAKFSTVLLFAIKPITIAIVMILPGHLYKIQTICIWLYHMHIHEWLVGWLVGQRMVGAMRVQYKICIWYRT